MIRKFYDADYGFSGGGVYVTKSENINDKTVIECECGSHLLRVESDTEIYFNSDLSQQYRQTYYLAIFTHGNDKRGFWNRLKVAFNYLKKGTFFKDQICLTPDEAKSLSSFIIKNEVNPK